MISLEKLGLEVNEVGTREALRLNAQPFFQKATGPMKNFAHL